MRALTGLALAFEVQLQSGAEADPAGLRDICRASEGLGSSGGADVLRALTGLALAFEVQLQSGVEADPAGLRDICRASEGLSSNGGADVLRALTGLALAFLGQLERTCVAWLQKLAWLPRPQKPRVAPKAQKARLGSYANIWIDMCTSMRI